MKEFPKGYRIKTQSGSQLEIIDKLGEGGQGIVYRVSYNGKQMALKWYFPENMQAPERFYQNLQKNIKLGAPTKAFLWPQEVTEKTDGSFGYLMDLFPNDYKSFSKILLGKYHLSGIHAVINAALCISNGFRDLHRRGYSYQDLNDGNFCVNTQNGDVLICDNDNVAEYGDNLGIAGKCRYMAPEVGLGKKRPDVHTDRFSMAVVLYLLLFANHPLEGQKTLVPCMTEAYEQKFYCTEPVFVYDPVLTNNRPVRGVHHNEIKLWPVYPEFIHQAFRDAFSQDRMIGSETEHRMGDLEWQQVFTKLRDRTVYCPKCGGETFVDPDDKSCKCMECGALIAPQMIIKAKGYTIPVIDRQKLYACHTVSDKDDFRLVTAEVNHAPNNPAVLGLKNLTATIWHVKLPDGTTKETENGRSTKLVPGMKIDFGNGVIAEVK